MLGRRSILILDADAYLAGLYARRFEQGRWRVQVAETVDEARKAIERRKPDAVIIDIENVEDGRAFLHVLHADPKTAGVALVVLTTLGDRQMIESALTAGADAYLFKGHFVPSEVRAKVERLVLEQSS